MRKIQMPDRLCHACNEGHCARCTGWDRTVVDGEIVLVACAHECGASAQKKSVKNVARSAQRNTRRA
jgi:hypothetical protein